MSDTIEQVKVQGKTISKEEFKILEETINKDKNKKLKKLSESEYTVLQKLEG